MANDHVRLPCDRGCSSRVFKLGTALEHIFEMKFEANCEETRARRNKPSHRSITPGVLRQSGDRTRTRTRGTTQSSQCNWAWLPKRMADLRRRRRQCSERPLPAHQRERARGASAETAKNAAGTAGTTRRGAFLLMTSFSTTLATSNRALMSFVSSSVAHQTMYTDLEVFRPIW